MNSATTVKFQVTMPTNNYFAIGFNQGMIGTDMILWQANGAASKATDLWSTDEVTPQADTIQNINTTFTYHATHVIFTTERKLSTGDTSQDFVIKPVSSLY